VSLMGVMAKENHNEAPEQPQDANARHATDPAQKAKARKWFARAKQLADTHNYDYAIKCFIDGLALWPDAVEEAHVPLHGTATARFHGGGKKPGMMDSVKYSMTQKDPLKAMLNAEWLLAHDPTNVNYLEGMFKNANKARCDDTLMWIGPIFRQAAEAEKKPHPKRFALLKEVYEALGDRCQTRGEPKVALEAYERALEALTVQKLVDPKNDALLNDIRDLSTKLTILKGNYVEGESFKDSLVDGEHQKGLHDRERMVHSQEQFEELRKAAEADWQSNPDVPSKLITLVDLLCRPENPRYEAEAIQLLEDEFAQRDDYRFKQRADDIRMKQLHRAERQAREAGDAEALRQAKIKALSFEIPIFAERVERYPTDLRFRYEYGVRLFHAQKFDEAIPMFQTARADPKSRTRCVLYIGRAFFLKKLYSQAITILREGETLCEIPDEETAKEITYWLARALEAAGESEAAQKAYGKLLQLDYNYRDVRVRIERFRDNA
jgi:tetratricopeptide (TPR) repeat protein